MTRAAIFAAVDAAVPGVWNKPGNIAQFDAVLDGFGVPREGSMGNPIDLQPSPVATDNIMAFEGLHKLRPDGKVEAYPDPASGGDPWTIGYGATGAGIRRGTVWTKEEAQERLRRDVERFAAGVREALGDAATTQGEFDALVSFAFNVGLGNLEKSTLLRKHKAGDKQGAALEFGKWTMASGRRLPGLVRRRQAEAAIYQGRRP
jgi:lysozyme